MLLAYIDESHTRQCDGDPDRHGFDVYQAQEGRITRYQLLGNTEGWFPSDLARITMPFCWEDSRTLYGLQMIDMALFMCGRAGTIGGDGTTSNAGDRAVLRTVDLILPALTPSSAVWYPMERWTDYGFLDHPDGNA